MPEDANRFVMGLDNNGMTVEAFRKRLEFRNKAGFVFMSKPDFLENAVELLRTWAESEGLAGDDLTIITREKNKKGEEVEVVRLSEALRQRIHDAIACEMMPSL